MLHPRSVPPSPHPNPGPEGQPFTSHPALSSPSCRTKEPWWDDGIEGQGRRGTPSKGTLGNSPCPQPPALLGYRLKNWFCSGPDTMVRGPWSRLCREAAAEESHRDVAFWKQLSVGVQKGQWGSLRASMDSITPELKKQLKFSGSTLD